MLVVFNGLTPELLSTFVSTFLKKATSFKQVSIPDIVDDSPCVVLNCNPETIKHLRRSYNAVTVFVTDADYTSPELYYPYQYIVPLDDMEFAVAQLINLLENHVQS